MQANDCGEPILFSDTVKERENIVRGGWIETSYGLVGKHDLRLLGQGAGNPDSLLLPAADRVHSLQCEV
jgi:hypothetical protein